MSTEGNWERQIIEKLALSAVDEQRKKRKWGIFFKSFFGLYLLLVLLIGWHDQNEGDFSGQKHTALVNMEGPISASSMASADNLISSLQKAFKDKNSVGVILKINSPGGSPVQAGQINDEIHRLRAKYPKKPFYVVVGDMCASGGYYVAVTGDKILVT